MTGKLKLGPLLDDKPVRLTLDLPADTHRSLIAYAQALKAQTQQEVEPAKLAAAMLAKFMAGDRGFVRGRGRRS